jgi:acetylornithine/succinyldiaminopimelate/putrescine aminotransferase
VASGAAPGAQVASRTRRAAFDREELRTDVAGRPLRRAKGLYLWLGEEPDPYLDLVQGYSTTIFGHCDTDLVSAAATALGTADHVMAVTSAAREELADLLSALTPLANGRAYFDVGGAHIVSLALRLARRVTARSHVLALADGFHGYSTEGEALSGTFVGSGRPAGDLSSLVETVAAGSGEALRLLRSGRYAAFLAEPLQGANGLAELSAEWLRDVARACGESGTILILDEVQVGMGRTGTFAASERYGVSADVVVYGKALCAGVFPLSAMVVAEEVYERVPPWPASALGSTFSCSPFGCAVGVHVVRRVQELLRTNRILELGAVFEQRLGRLVDRAGIRALRRYGLAIAFDFADPAAARRFGEVAATGRVLVALSGARRNVIKIYPPLTLTDDEAQLVCDELETICDAAGE